MSDKTYVVTAQGVIANTTEGTAVTLMRGAPLPVNADPDHLQHLLDNKLIAESEFTGGLQPVDAGDQSRTLTHPAGLDAADTYGDAEDDAESEDDVDGDGPIPAKSSPKADWVAYAVTQGETQEDAEASTKEELVSRYGG